MDKKLKLDHRSRVRVSYSISKEYYPEHPWRTSDTIRDICKEFDFIQTHKIYGVIFFRPTNELKYSLFMLKYGEYIIKKQSTYWRY